MKQIILALLIVLPFSMQSQSLEKGDENAKVGLLYEHDLSFGFRLYTNGWSIFANTGKNISAKKAKFYQFEFAEVKHNKEVKKSNDFYSVRSYSPKPFIFGKQNNFYALRAYIGKKIFLGDKAEKSGVEVNLVYQGGISIGFAKPYYIDIVQDDASGMGLELVSIKYSEETQNEFLNLETILGSSGFNKGLSEVKIIPGISAKAGINFDWANYSEVVRALEVGIMVDFYYRNIPLMVLETNKPYFVALYLGVQFGKKW